VNGRIHAVCGAPYTACCCFRNATALTIDCWPDSGGKSNRWPEFLLVPPLQPLTIQHSLAEKESGYAKWDSNWEIQSVDLLEHVIMSLFCVHLCVCACACVYVWMVGLGCACCPNNELNRIIWGKLPSVPGRGLWKRVSHLLMSPTILMGQLSNRAA
jgi:hypothetical protein